MQQLLHARECGDDVHGLDDMLSARWANLSEDPRRLWKVIFCASLDFIDVERSSGSLILCGGETHVLRGPNPFACVGVFRYVKAGEKSTGDHLVQHMYESNPEAIGFSCGRWFPNDSAIFVTGTAANGEVIVWDTERFVPVSNFQLGKESTVLATEMSLAPGARTELVAVGRTNSSDVTLVDMGTGAATHQLQTHNFPITGATWAPLNPYQVASIDEGGFGCLFDIRRSGKTACLVQFNLTRRMPTFETTWARRKHLQEGFSQGKLNSLSSVSKARLLGLSCIWNQNFEHRTDRKRRLNGKFPGLRAQGPPLNRVRFMPSGSELITNDSEGVLRIWDIFTGRLERTHNTAAKLTSHAEEDGKGTFEVSRDGMHILCDARGSLMALDAEEGFVVQCSEGSTRNAILKDLVLHPWEEEAVSIQRDTVSCWSSGDNNKTESEFGSE